MSWKIFPSRLNHGLCKWWTMNIWLLHWDYVHIMEAAAFLADRIFAPGSEQIQGNGQFGGSLQFRLANFDIVWPMLGVRSSGTSQRRGLPEGGWYFIVVSEAKAGIAQNIGCQGVLASVPASKIEGIVISLPRWQCCHLCIGWVACFLNCRSYSRSVYYHIVDSCKYWMPVLCDCCWATQRRRKHSL